jgi:RHS repeat-associated protein
MPYGEVIDPPTTQESVLFTGKPKDTESGLDEFGPRKFSSSLCRWISSDVLFTKKRIGNPQTWNLYTYCADNPTKFTDPTGLWQVSQVEDTDKKGKKSIQLRIVQSNKDDTASGLAKQLGFADNKKLINKIEGMLQKDSSGINGKDLPGIIGRTFKVAEKGLTAQASFIQQPGGDPGPNVPRMMDCSMTSAQIAFPSAMQGVFSNGQWGTHSTNVMISNSQLQTVQSGGERVGDLVRWGEGRGLHFANVLFINDDGNVDVFSRSGNRGRFEIVGINDDIGYGTNYSIFRPKE